MWISGLQGLRTYMGLPGKAGTEGTYWKHKAQHFGSGGEKKNAYSAQYGRGIPYWQAD